MSSSRKVYCLVLTPIFLITGAYFGGGKVGGGYPALRAFPMDDAYIHLVYATSLARSFRLEYNRGVPESGMSSPLWVIAESPFVLASHLLRVSPLLAVHLLNLLLAALLALSIMAWVREMSSGEWPGCLAAAAVLFEPALGFSRFAGMEVILSALLLVCACRHWQKEKSLAAGLLFALAILTRLENVLLLGTCFFIDLTGKDRARRGAALLLPTVLALALWFVFNQVTTGRPLPNTFYVKGRVALELAEAGRIVWFMAFDLPFFKWVAGFSLYVLGVYLMIKKLGVRALPAALFPWLFILGVACTRHNFSNYWAYYFHRYFQPCIPFLVASWAMGAAWVVQKTAAGFRSDTGFGLGKKVFLAAGALILLSSIIPWPGRMAHWRELLAWNSRNIEEIHVTLGRWVEKNTEPSDVIATRDAGAVRYYGGRHTLDLMGLNSHDMLADPIEGFFRARPDYIIMPDSSGYDESSREWRLFSMGARSIWIRPEFSADAERYTVTEGFTSRQTALLISYENPANN
jgi:hypothetical protein